MKIDAETLKKQVILHLPYVLFLLVFAKLGEAVRLAPGADASQKLLGLSEGFALSLIHISAQAPAAYSPSSPEATTSVRAAPWP